MKHIELMILGMNGLLGGGLIILLIYFIFYQMKQRKTEDFEKRDN